MFKRIILVAAIAATPALAACSPADTVGMAACTGHVYEADAVDLFADVHVQPIDYVSTGWWFDANGQAIGYSASEDSDICEVA